MRVELSIGLCGQRGGMRSDYGSLDATEDFGNAKVAQPHSRSTLVELFATVTGQILLRRVTALGRAFLFRFNRNRGPSTPVVLLCLCRDSRQLHPSKLSHHNFCS